MSNCCVVDLCFLIFLLHIFIIKLMMVLLMMILLAVRQLITIVIILRIMSRIQLLICLMLRWCFRSTWISMTTFNGTFTKSWLLFWWCWRQNICLRSTTLNHFSILVDWIGSIFWLWFLFGTSLNISWIFIITFRTRAILSTRCITFFA